MRCWGKFVTSILVIFLFTSMFVLFSLGSVSAQSEEPIELERIDQEWWDGYNLVYFNAGHCIMNNSLGQSFIPTKDVLSAVGLYLTYVSPEGSIEVTIYKAKDNGYPDLSNPLASSQLEDNVFLQYQMGEYVFDFQDIPVTPGDTYFITVQSGIGYNWRDTHPLKDGNYTNGSAWLSLHSEDFGYEYPDNDFLFRTYYNGTGFKPIANAGLDQEVAFNELVYFSGEDSYDLDGTIVSYNWDFGDNSTGQGMNITHTYLNPGQYIVCLNVTDNDGLFDLDYCNVTVTELPNILPVPSIQIGGYLGHYYNLPCNHSEVGGKVTGLEPGDTPFNHDWYDETYYSFSRIDPDLTFGADFFPVDEGLEGDPLYFAVHWETTIEVLESGNYTFEIGSDDDSWVYIDDEMVCDLGGIHGLDILSYTIHLYEGEHDLDIYFAERRRVQSGFYFEFIDVDLNPQLIVSELESPVQLLSNKTYSFSALNSYDVDGMIVNYTWDFGDGSVLEGLNVEHIYSTSGEIDLTLNVTDDRNGASIQTVEFLIVSSDSDNEELTLHTEYPTDNFVGIDDGTGEYGDVNAYNNIELLDVEIPVGLLVFIVVLIFVAGIAFGYRKQ